MKRTYCLLILWLLCGTGLQAQSTDLLPFTGAMVKGTGIRYKDIEIRIQDDLMAGSDLPRNQKMTIKLTDPWSLISDEKGNVFPGAGYRILDMKRKVLTEQKNIFSNDQPGIPRNYLKSLSVSVTISDELKNLDSVIVQARFFDKMDDDSVLIEIPCRLVPKGKGIVATSWGTFSGTFIAKGAYNLFNPGKVKGQKLKRNASSDDMDTACFTIERLDGLKNTKGKVFFNSIYTLYDEQFNIIEQKKDFIVGSSTGIDPSRLTELKYLFMLPKKLKSGFARIVITDKNSAATLDVILPFNSVF